MSKLWKEFREFAFKGNMIELAVAVIIGAAFGAVVNSLVKNVIMPVLSYVFPTQGGYTAWHSGRVQIGLFLGELVNFLVVALAVFVIIVKVMGALMKRAAPPPPAGEPTTKECPFCLMVVPIKALKCGHCTSELPAA